jgi:hypothetical protein
MSAAAPQELAVVYDPDDRRKVYRVIRDGEGVRIVAGERTVWRSKTRSRLSPNVAGMSAAVIRELSAVLAKVDPW